MYIVQLDFDRLVIFSMLIRTVVIDLIIIGLSTPRTEQKVTLNKLHDFRCGTTNYLHFYVKLTGLSGSKNFF